MNYSNTLLNSSTNHLRTLWTRSKLLQEMMTGAARCDTLAPKYPFLDTLFLWITAYGGCFFVAMDWQFLMLSTFTGYSIRHCQMANSDKMAVTWSITLSSRIVSYGSSAWWISKNWVNGISWVEQPLYRCINGECKYCRRQLIFDTGIKNTNQCVPSLDHCNAFLPAVDPAQTMQLICTACNT